MRGLMIGLTLATGAALAAPGPRPRHNVILFVADGLRAGMVTPANAPTMVALMARGVRFANTHSMFPTFTTANASAFAIGHKLGDTGDFSNTIDVGGSVAAAGGSRTPFIENDAILGELDTKFDGDYLGQETVMAAARRAGIATAVVGKVGPTLIFDHTAAGRAATIVIDDNTGGPGGIPLAPEVAAALAAAGLGGKAPGRGANGASGTVDTPGTLVANIDQQAWFLGAATKVVLPALKARHRPFFMVYWSRDPDGTQHNQGDSLGRLVPGINGPTSLAAIRDADQNLRGLLDALDDQGLAATTDIIIAADHGFSTISKDSATSYAASRSYPGVTPGTLPPGFVAIDLAHALGLPLFDPDAGGAAVADGVLPKRGNGLIGDPVKPRIVVAANGGSDLIYIPDHDAATTRGVVDLLAAQDYTSGMFVDQEIGDIPGTMSLGEIDLAGKAVTPRPAVVVNFRSFSTGCADPTTCGVEIADTALQAGQGMHGNFSRADTRPLGGAAGPDFARGLVDKAPTSNADIGRTIAHLLGVQVREKGRLVGRVLSEAMPGGNMPTWTTGMGTFTADRNGRRTIVCEQWLLGKWRYLDAAGYLGRTLGIPGEGNREDNPSHERSLCR